MKTITRLLIAALALTCTTCAAPPPTTREAITKIEIPITVIVPQTIEVTRIVTRVATPTVLPSTASTTSTPTVPPSPSPTPSTASTTSTPSTPSIPLNWITYTHPAGHLIAHLPPTAKITNEAAHILSLTLAGGSGVILLIIAGPTGPTGDQAAIEKFAGRILHEQPALDTIRVIATGAYLDPPLQANYIELLRTDYITEASYHQLYLSIPVTSTPIAHIEALILHSRQIPAQDRADFLQIAASLRLPPP